jgi:hypothetical protein
MRRKGQGSASISAVVVFLSALLAIGLMATILPPVANVLSGFREGLRERGERGSELIRIYIHTANETENEPPIITIINGYDRESILTDYVVVARDGRVLAAGKMGGSLGGIRIPAGARIDLTPADFGLSYGTFAAMADEVKAIYIRTAEGNSFGSSYGPPPKISPDYQFSVTQKPHHVIVEGSTTMIFNFTIFSNFTFPPLGNAIVVKNFIIVDENGLVKGGASFGRKWSDGSFDPNWLPDEVAALTQPEVVPINGYYTVPPFPNYPTRYIEMIEFYPVEYYTPGSPVGATAYYARFAEGGRLKPIVPAYPYGVPGSYTTTISYPVYTTRGIFVTHYTTSETRVINIWPEGGLVKYAPAPVPVRYGTNLDTKEWYCYVIVGTHSSGSCSFTIYPPSPSPVAITAVGYRVDPNLVCSDPNPYYWIYVYVQGPWGSGLPTSDVVPGPVTFRLVVETADCYYTVWLSGWVVYKYPWVEGTATTATATATVILGDFRSQIRQAVSGVRTLSGDAVAHMVGTVQGGQVIRVKAPIVVLNYISGSVPSPPPSPGGGGGGGGGEIGPTMHCEATGQPLVAPSSTSRPATDISGNIVPNISVQQRQVTIIWSGFCRPK